MTTPPHLVEARAEGHTNATLEHRVVRGFVRDDADWRPAIAQALRIAYDPASTAQDSANAIDAAMMRAIHAAARTGAVHDLGVVSKDSTNPLARGWWRLVGSRAAARRAARFNRETAGLAGKEG